MTRIISTIAAALSFLYFGDQALTLLGAEDSAMMAAYGIAAVMSVAIVLYNLRSGISDMISLLGFRT